MATTTNFGWETPDDTDLVKDGALAMRTLGNAIDTSLVDLKGGTTGQVLSKTSNTDMDFTWVTSDDANAIQNTIVDAKGDLITATGSDVPARLAVGNNGDTLLADSSTSTGLRYQATKSTQNAIINGAFDIWQRGTSFTSSNVYSADRWYTYTDGSAATWSRQAGSGEFQYAMRIARNSGSTNTGLRDIWYNSAIEEATQFAGKTITLSFYAKAGANYSAASNALSINGYSGTSSTDANRVNGAYASGDTQIIGQTFNITTTLTRYSVTLTLGASVTQFAFGFRFTPTGTAGANDWVEITGVQWEVGSTPTTFRRSGGTLQGELAACQRYYFRFANDAINKTYFLSRNFATTAARGIVFFPVTMRTAPTFGSSAGSTFSVWTNTDFAGTAIAGFDMNSTAGNIQISVASGLTANDATAVLSSSSSTTSYLEFSSEL
jgi:hypothetical protein